jgi:hypothetical protein
MIYNCWYCGWRINERREGEKDNDCISKYKLWNHHPFCSDCCIKLYKEYGCTTKAPIADWEENGVYGYWKVKRKIGRIRKKRT